MVLVGSIHINLFSFYFYRVVLNEIAPRPHNSGHYTIEACNTSQFENHLRAIVGLTIIPKYYFIF